MLGIKPGPMMIVHDLPLVWSLIWAIAISNLLCTGFLLVVGKHMSALAHIRASVLVPIVLVFALLGTYLAKDHWESLLVFAGMGAIGYVMRRNQWPRPCFIIGLVLGPTAELSFHKAFALHGLGFLSQPTSLVMMAIIAVTLTVNLRKTYRRKAAGAAAGAGHVSPIDGPVLPRR
jgi:putative tricarboxylic transport membrane protein